MEATIYALAVAPIIYSVASIVLVVLLLKHQWSALAGIVLGGLVGGFVGYLIDTETEKFYAIKGEFLHFFLELTGEEARIFIGLAIGLLVGMLATAVAAKRKQHA
ncbi:MAG: hypothetical protein GY746_17245 [Gammaproteobacteria bacterium]|nr:hypothetical protein [Gammaproteobacteria bacterium]